MKHIGAKHVPHECRHTFRTWMDAAPPTCTNRIMGHKSGDIGQDVYTHKTLLELQAAIETIKHKNVQNQKMLYSK
jgi:integrase